MPDKHLINQLKHIKDSFRNPTQHPEKLYSVDEAQDLFGICIDVINKMAELIKS